MSTTTDLPPREYALGRGESEYQRLRRQAWTWEHATRRLLDEIGLAPGSSCLDVGCGPGETMRLMAERVGANGRVCGVDVDGALGAHAVAALHAAGHRQCSFAQVDLVADEPIPGGLFDLVYARLLLYHLPQRVDVLARMWDQVRPGGVLLVQDYDVRATGVLPALASADAVMALVVDAFEAAGCDVSVGARLPQLFAQAGIGTPNGTDVAGRLESFGTGHAMLDAVCRSVLPTALAHGQATEVEAEVCLEAMAADAERDPDRPMLWPLMIGAWKRKAASA